MLWKNECSLQNPRGLIWKKFPLSRKVAREYRAEYSWIQLRIQGTKDTSHSAKCYYSRKERESCPFWWSYHVCLTSGPWLAFPLELFPFMPSTNDEFFAPNMLCREAMACNCAAFSSTRPSTYKKRYHKKLLRHSLWQLLLWLDQCAECKNAGQ